MTSDSCEPMDAPSAAATSLVGRLPAAQVARLWQKVIEGVTSTRPHLIANTSDWVVHWDLILILSAAVILGLAVRTVGRRSRTDPPAEADDASLQPAGAESASAAI